MERVAAGAEETALVVVDPHQDLAEAVLASVPDALVDRTVYLDFANLDRPIGLNLIDVALFPDRDRTIEHVVTMLNRLWPANWGPRMEGALRASLSALHELNTRARESTSSRCSTSPRSSPTRICASACSRKCRIRRLRVVARQLRPRGTRAAAADRESGHLEDRALHGHRGRAASCSGRRARPSTRARCCATAACSSSTRPSARSAKARRRWSARRC